VISRFEKVALIILSSLGAGYWGYGLMLYLMIPGEYKYWFGIETGVGAGMFLIYGVAIGKNRINRRLTAWALFFVVLIFASLIVYLIETWFQPRTETW